MKKEKSKEDKSNIFLSYPSFSLLWLARLISSLGDRLHMIALGWAIWKITGSSLYIGFGFMAIALPHLIFGFPGGALVDSLNKKKAMILSDFARFFLVLLIPLVLEVQLNVVFVLVFLVSLFTLIFNPSQNSLVPEIVEKEHLLKANSYLMAVDSLADVIGYPLAGVLVATLGYNISFYVDSFSYLVSGLILCLLPFGYESFVLKKLDLSRIHSEVLKGWEFIKSNQSIFYSNMVFFAAPLVGGGMDVLIPPFVSQVLKGGAKEYGWMEAAMAIGGILGSLLLARFGSKNKKGFFVSTGLAGMGFAIMLVGRSQFLYLALFFYFLAGFFNLLFFISHTTLLQEHTPLEMRGRVFAVRSSLVYSGLFISRGWSGALGDVLGSALTLTVIGLLLGLVGLGSFFIPALRDA